MAAPALAFTISRTAEILGRGRAALVGLSRRDALRRTAVSEIHGAKDQQTIAFTPRGMEYLRDPLAEHKRNRPPAVLNGWFLLASLLEKGVSRAVDIVIPGALHGA